MSLKSRIQDTLESIESKIEGPPPAPSAPSLPQDDPEHAVRAARLRAARQEYNYTEVDELPGVPLSDGVPKSEDPDIAWWIKFAAIFAKLLENRLAIGMTDDAEDEHNDLIKKLVGVKPGSDTSKLPALFDLVRAAKAEGIEGRPINLQSYTDLFRTLPLPELALVWPHDETFGWLQVAGFDPMVLQGIDAVPEGFDVTDADLAAVTGEGDTLGAAGPERRLYLADYGALRSLTNGVFPNASKYVYPARALFALPCGEGPRVPLPVAIQCDPDAGSAVFTPADGKAWALAKTAVTSAAFAFHEASSHLGRTHLIMEPFAVSTRRQLSDRHPVYRLVLPAVEGTIYINNLALGSLINDGGSIDKAFGGTIETIRGASAAIRLATDFNGLAVPQNIADRKLDDPRLVNPWRDDASLVWEAVADWVRAYIDLYYADDAAVQADSELRAWALEIASDTGGRLQGFGDAPLGAIRSKATLVRMLAIAVYTGGPGHATVNFAQRDTLMYPPATPTGLFRAAPTSVADAARNPELDYLPPLDIALTAVETTYELGSMYYTTLGGYSPGWFGDPKVDEPLKAYQARLEEIEAIIDRRNLDRLLPYTFLKPSLLPASTNI